MVVHDGMINHLYAKLRDLQLTGEDTIAQTASQCFDISVWQLIGALLTACTTPLMQTTRLDSSGLTIVTLADAVLLARPVRTLAAGARDYAYVGPVEINRMGHHEYFFWIGLASTVDRERVGLTPDDAIALAVLIDGEPMFLPLTEWDMTLDMPPYETSAPVYATLAAPTSLDQIHRIAAADAVELHIVTVDDATARYQTWQGDWTSWSAFAADE